MTEATRSQKVQNYDRQIQTLRQLGYLEQSELSFQHRVLTGAVSRAFVTLIHDTIATNDIWEFSFPTNQVSVLVTCRKSETAKWQKLVSDYDTP